MGRPPPFKKQRQAGQRKRQRGQIDAGERRPVMHLIGRQEKDRGKQQGRRTTRRAPGNERQQQRREDRRRLDDGAAHGQAGRPRAGAVNQGIQRGIERRIIADQIRRLIDGRVNAASLSQPHGLVEEKAFLGVELKRVVQAGPPARRQAQAEPGEQRDREGQHRPRQPAGRARGRGAGDGGGVRFGHRRLSPGPGRNVRPARGPAAAGKSWRWRPAPASPSTARRARGGRSRARGPGYRSPARADPG
ncbi:MAG: hypothetical protein BWZ08_02027 [candidate division BRC1 bacterium ADurb.BinA292]|nr:MAG: hypothetical protein BWZ08_02027 [candidate division BRC1 bacterium ADurb.BinA292]